ncbi:hypothetical protein LINPERPRIM_LOCUS20068 [Linum perenne]
MLFLFYQPTQNFKI